MRAFVNLRPCKFADPLRIRSGSRIRRRRCEFPSRANSQSAVRNHGSAANSQIHCEFAAAANLQRIREFSQNHIYKCKTEVLGGSNGTVAQSIKNASKKYKNSYFLRKSSKDLKIPMKINQLNFFYIITFPELGSDSSIEIRSIDFL